MIGKNKAKFDKMINFADRMVNLKKVSDFPNAILAMSKEFFP
jgi:hypothetical protein